MFSRVSLIVFSLKEFSRVSLIVFSPKEFSRVSLIVFTLIVFSPDSVQPRLADSVQP